LLTQTTLPKEKNIENAIVLVVAAVSNEHGQPEALILDARATVTSIKSFIRDQDILRLTDPDRCQVIEMPEFRRGNSLTYLFDAYQSEGNAKLKIVRAKQSSVQLSTYFAGRMAHYRLRQAIQRELGDKFEIGRFHEAVLDHGSVPMKFLPALVRTRLAQPR
jgi:hypothetical protein